MSVYSSDDDATNDAFGLSKLPANKKLRTQLQNKLVSQAAPHVLAEVRPSSFNVMVTYHARRTL